MKTVVSASAPGKVILFGEHFVVSGFPAIVTAIDKRVRVTFSQSLERKFIIVSGQAYSAWNVNAEPLSQRPSLFQPLYNMVKKLSDDFGFKCVGKVEIFSEITGAAGLGSSAAVSVALTKAVSDMYELNLTPEQVIQYAMVAEKEFHGRPSGIDTTIATVGGTIAYHSPGNYRQINVPANPEVIIVFSGKKRKTSKMVEHVQQTAKAKPAFFNALANIYSRVYCEAVDAMTSTNFEKLGHLFLLNHFLLRCLGLSNEGLEKIVEDLLSFGAFGAKVTGGGGGGCVIGLGGEKSSAILAGLSTVYPKVWLSQTGCRGVGE
ncbi:MAG: mevalonate kinase [Candidatus Caldarchaeum sp.]